MRVDRTTTTPFLIRIFSNHGGFHRLDEFDHDIQPRDEINLYSWKDATLGELTTLLAKELVGDSKRGLSSFRFSYRLIFGDANRGRYLTKDLGTVSLHDKSADSGKTLDDARFIIGDWIAIAVLQPGDRLYDSRYTDRDNRPSRDGRGGHRGGYNGVSSYRDRQHMDNYRPYDRNDRDRRRPPRPMESRRWGNDSYRPDRRS